MNDLARELEVKTKTIILALPKVGIDRAVTHASSLNDDEAAKVRAFFATPPQRRTGNATLGLAKSIAARFGEEI